MKVCLYTKEQFDLYKGDAEYLEVVYFRPDTPERKLIIKHPTYEHYFDFMYYYNGVKHE